MDNYEYLEVTYNKDRKDRIKCIICKDSFQYNQVKVEHVKGQKSVDQHVKDRQIRKSLHLNCIKEMPVDINGKPLKVSNIYSLDAADYFKTKKYFDNIQQDNIRKQTKI